MIINHTHKFVFVHVPKTAGTAVSTMLSTLSTYRDQEIGVGAVGLHYQRAFGRRFGLVKHSPAHRIRAVMGKEDWNAYFTFAFARNPFARLLSIYHFLRTWEDIPEPEAKRLAPYTTFEEFLEGDLWATTPGPSGMYRPQTYWMTTPRAPRTMIVDFVGRHEQLVEDMAHIAAQIGGDVRLDTARKANVTPHYSREVRWSDAAIARVVEHYASDFELLGYPDRPEKG